MGENKIQTPPAPTPPPAPKPAAPKKTSREELIQKKVNIGLTREMAIEVIERQEREDAERAKAKK